MSRHNQWEFQDPKMKVLYHMFGHILWGYPLKLRPEKYGLYMVGTSNKSVPEMAIESRTCPIQKMRP